MALLLKDRVKETTTTAGLGTLTLAGSADTFEPFSAISQIRVLWESDIITPDTWTPHVMSGDYLLDAVAGNFLTDENGNRLTAPVIWAFPTTTPATWTED